ncbi:FAD-binding protein [Roseovarius bejariae]|uniref:FAD-binding protein n=1 Tax=Roseovarius bejariae TaxID=2576383 RepID=UPI0031B5B29D
MLTPQSEAELAEIVAGADVPLRIIGGGTRPIGASAASEVLSTAGISGITLYEPGALTLVAKAGTPVEEIEAALAEEGQMLAFEPMDHRRLLGTSGTPTIGGVVAGNVSGPRRVSSVGACRDSLLGVRFVDGAGRILKNGGRVMKNVTGYDLNKLLCGSWGTLGVLSEVALKVLPRPAATATLTLKDVASDRAVPAMAAALGTPYEVNGAFFGPYGPEGGTLRIRVEGALSSVKYRAEELAKCLAPYGEAEIETDAEANRALWIDIRDMAYLADKPVVLRSSIKPGDAPGFVDGLPSSHPALHYFDWGGGLIWTAAEAAPDDGARGLVSSMQAAMTETGGHSTVLKAPDGLRQGVSTFQPPVSAVAAIEAGLRARFDPQGLFNPGLMGQAA